VTLRAVIAVVAVCVLAVTGLEWGIKARADQGLVEHQVDALVDVTTPAGTPDVTGGTTGSTPTATTPPPAGEFTPENILLLGSDTRSGDNADAGNSDASTEDGVANSDTLMLAHISADRHVTVVSFPRDTMITAPQCQKWDSATGDLTDEPQPISPGERWHINSAYSVGGPTCTVRAIQELTGLKVDRVIGIDFAGFKNMVDALGGISVNVCGPIVDAELQTVVADGGVQTIQGDQALSLVRARKVIGDTDSDLARIRRQQVVLSAILQQVTSAGTLLNPSRLDGFLQAFVNNTFTANVSIDDLVTLAQSFGNLDPSTVTFYTLPTVPDPSDADALELDAPKANAVFAALRNDERLPGEEPDPAPSTTSVTPAPPSDPATSAAAPPLVVPATVTVDPAALALRVVNATGRSGAATRTMEALLERGFALSDTDLATAPTAAGAAVVQFPADRLADAVTVAAALPGATLQEVDDPAAAVTLVLGTEFQTDGPSGTGDEGDGTDADGDGVPDDVAVTTEPVAVGDPTPAWVTLSDTVGAPVATEAGDAADPSADDGSASAPTTATLTSGDLQSVNAGQALCA
jgi:LCP family protein required for cell wall assembly